MNGSFRWLLVLAVGSGLLAACAAATPPTATPASATETQALCLDATRRAIDLEIAKYRNWLQNATDDAQRAMYQQALDYLQAQQTRYREMRPTDYHVADAWRYIPNVVMGTYGNAPLPPSPEPVTLDEAWVEGDLPGLLSYAGQTRSGPFYFVTGVKGGFGQLQRGEHYRLVLQPVMPQSYPFPSFYVCVLSAEHK